MTHKPTPREPTAAMFIAGTKAFADADGSFARVVWYAMWDAATAPPDAPDPIAEHIAQSPFGDDAPADDLCARLDAHADRMQKISYLITDGVLREAAARIAAQDAELIRTGALYIAACKGRRDFRSAFREARDGCKAAEARCRKLEQDAARYRFLRNTMVYDTGLAVADVPDARDDIEFIYDAQLDSAVDRARAKYRRDKENADR